MDRVYYYDVSLDGGTIADATIESQVRIYQSATSYNDLEDKPSIEGVSLVGDRTFRDLGLEEITAQDIDEIIFGGG